MDICIVKPNMSNYYPERGANKYVLKLDIFYIWRWKNKEQGLFALIYSPMESYIFSLTLLLSNLSLGTNNHI